MQLWHISKWLSDTIRCLLPSTQLQYRNLIDNFISLLLWLWLTPVRMYQRLFNTSFDRSRKGLTDYKVFNIQWQCLQEQSDPAVQEFTGILSTVHEYYLPQGSDWDVAVIRLPRPLTYNNAVQPICLPRTPVAAGTKCFVTGWGDTESRKTRHAILFRFCLW